MQFHLIGLPQVVQEVSFGDVFARLCHISVLYRMFLVHVVPVTVLVVKCEIRGSYVPCLANPVTRDIDTVRLVQRQVLGDVLQTELHHTTVTSLGTPCSMEAIESDVVRNNSLEERFNLSTEFQGRRLLALVNRAVAEILLGHLIEIATEQFITLDNERPVEVLSVVPDYDIRVDAGYEVYELFDGFHFSPVEFFLRFPFNTNDFLESLVSPHTNLVDSVFVSLETFRLDIPLHTKQVIVSLVTFEQSGSG